MCRFTLYLGGPITLQSLLFSPKNSLVHQSLYSPILDRPVHGDGFGVAWYSPELTPTPALFRCTSPAWNSSNLRHLARVTQSGVILAHVRAASDGLVVSQPNCHPFAAGRLSFAHNGYLEGFPQMRFAITARLSQGTAGAIAGSTDSEYLFALFRERYGALPGPPGSAKLARALEVVVDEIRTLQQEQDVFGPCLLNMVVTDGNSAAACRVSTSPEKAPLSLFVSSGERYLVEDGACNLTDTAGGEGAVLISSEALCGGDRWEEVPPDHLVLAERGGELEVRPMG